jgi:hypothetical protein
MTTAITAAGEKQRTTVRIELRGDPWPVIDGWGKATGYIPNTTTATQHSRLYQKGIGFWVAPQMLAAQVDGNILTLQAWIRGTFIARLFSLFILPAEIRIASGGMTAAIPRKMARGDVNKLIQQLGGPPIT